MIIKLIRWLSWKSFCGKLFAEFFP